MSIIAVQIVCSTSAIVAAVVASLGIKRGTASVRDLWFISIGALVLAAILSIYLLFWSTALGGNMRELLLPDFLASRPKRAMFTAYVLGSAGIATGLVALLVALKGLLGKA